MKPEDVLSTVELLAKDLPKCAELLTIAPQFKRQQDSYDKVLRIITHLLHLVTILPASQDQNFQMTMRQRIHNIVHSVDPRTTSGDSLLHLSVAKNNTLKTQNLFDDGQYSFFPSPAVAKLLVECGAKVNAANDNASTPLHAACMPANYKQEVSFCRNCMTGNKMSLTPPYSFEILQIVEMLLSNGAHVDARNASSQRPTDLLRAIPGCKVNPLQFTTLRCLAAAAISKHSVCYEGQVPEVLEDFVKVH